MMFIQLVLICFCGFTPTIYACAEWSIISPPIIFGQTARLGCELQNGTEGSTRTWLGGPGYISISIDGASSNPKKYMEVTSREPFRSLLEIYNFSENDVDCEYSCSIGFHEDRHTLSLNPEDFELHPTRASTAIVATLRKGHLVADVSMMKVYPEPKCKIKFQEKYYTVTTNSEKNGKFLSVHIKLDHTFETHVCKGQLILSCIVGNSDVEVYSQYFHTCPDISEEKTVSNEANDYLPYIIAVFLFVLVVLFIGVVYLRKCQNPGFCNYCSKSGDNVALDHVRQDGHRPILAVQSPGITIEDNNHIEGNIAKADGKDEEQGESYAMNEMKTLMPNEQK